MALGGCSGCAVALLSVLQIAAAASVIAITGLRLAGVDLHSADSILHPKTCLLAEGGDNTTVCFYAYVLGAVSIVFSLAIGLLQVCTCIACGAVMDTVMAVLAAGWWVVGALILSANAGKASAAGQPAGEWRGAVVWLSWAAAALFAALFATHLARVFSKCCCRRRRGGTEADGGKAAPPKPRPRALQLGDAIRGRSYMGGAGGGGGAAPGSPLQQQFVTQGENNI